MTPKRRCQLAVLLVAGVCLFSSLGESRFWDQDEGYFAGTAAEMFAAGDWIVPTFNGELFGHKPPWMYWMMMTGFTLFGVTEFAARFFSAIFGVATALLTFQLGHRLFNARTGLLAGIAMPSCLMFGVVARAATPDVYLVFFSTLSLYLFAVRILGCTGDSPPRRRDWLIIYLPLGLATLAKGPIGFLFPGAVMGLYLLISNNAGDFRKAIRPIQVLRTLVYMRPILAAVVILTVAAPWFIAVGIQTQGAFLSEFFLVHHWQRFTTPLDNHHGPIYYYLFAILIGLFPWSIYAGPVLVDYIRRLAGKDPQSRQYLFLGCWIIVYVGVFSIASTKLPNYVLPAYPALAILVAKFIDDALRRSDSAVCRQSAWSFFAMLLTGTVVLSAVWVTRIETDGQTIWDRYNLDSTTQYLVDRIAILSLPLLVFGGLAMYWAFQKRLPRAYSCALAGSLLFSILFWNDTVPFADQYQHPQSLIQGIREDGRLAEDSRLAQFGFFRPSNVFYGGRRIESCHDANDVAEFLDRSEPGAHAFIITTSEQLARLQPIIGQLEIVERLPEFPSQNEILLIQKNRATTANIGDRPDRY